MHKQVIWIFGVVFLLSTTFLLLACNPAAYRADADRESYCIIQQKSAGIEGMPAGFTIERQISHVDVPQIDEATRVLTITETLQIAVDHSREHQSRREQVFLQALTLSMERHRFNPIYFGQGNFTLNNDSFKKSIAGVFSFGFNQMLATGADLSVDMSTNLFRIISGGNPGEIAASALSVRAVQPLLRGAGYLVTLENLTQGERDMVYTIRDYVRYRREFSVEIINSYLSLLGQQDQVANAESNLKSLDQQREIVVNRVLAGLSSPIEADQATQQVLEARDSLLRAQASYERVLDLFKIQLGIPTEVRILPKAEELQQIAARGIDKALIPPRDGVKIALENRLDLQNARDRVEDYRRKVLVSEDLLKPGLDLILGYGADSDRPKAMLDFADGEKDYTVGVDVDLPLDRKAERNTYRQSFIRLAAAERDLVDLRDRIAYEVRNAIRNVDLAVDRYQNQVKSLELSRVRVERDSLLLQAGRAITRDVLESQADLLRAQNAVTSSIIDYYNAKLDLLLAMENMEVDEHGFISEGKNYEWEYVDQ